MTEYAKKKNDELAALCKERGLPHTGKKADLVKRLEDHDASNSSAAPGSATEATTAPTPGVVAPAEDEIDWDDEPATETAKHATSEPAAAAIAAGGLGQVANPQAVPNQQVGEDVTDPAPSNTNTEAAGVSEGLAQKEKTPVDFSAGLAETTLDEEIAKRKRRAEKFGLDPKADETLKMLERAKRFGDTKMTGLLNQALPEKAEREKKRGREGGQDGGVRKSRGRPGMGVRQDSGRKERPANGTGGGPGKGSWMTDKDRDAAEKRKARFAPTAAE